MRIRLPALLKTPYSVQAEVIKASAKALFKAGERGFSWWEKWAQARPCLRSPRSICSPGRRGFSSCVPRRSSTSGSGKPRRRFPGCVRSISRCRRSSRLLQQFRHFPKKPEVPEIYVMSKEKAKLSYPWRPAALTKKHDFRVFCPRCAAVAIENDEYLTMEDLRKKRRTCGACGSPFWQADRSLRRFAPAEYIKKYLKRYWDLIVIDEIQAYKAEGTLQGRAMGSLLSAIPYAACLTGTLNGGYADDLFALLFRMNPGQLIADGFDYGASNKFLATYGTIEEVRKIEEEDTRRGRGRKKVISHGGARASRPSPSESTSSTSRSSSVWPTSSTACPPMRRSSSTTP